MLKAHWNQRYEPRAFENAPRVLCWATGEVPLDNPEVDPPVTFLPRHGIMRIAKRDAAHCTIIEGLCSNSKTAPRVHGQVTGRRDGSGY
eukprot:14049431-Alexandrium_andersonii.AAC.1